MAERQIDIKKRFIERYLESMCEPKPEEVLQALIDDEITDIRKLRNYMICHDYQIQLIENGGKVRETYDELAISFDLTTRQIERIVSHWLLVYRKKLTA